MPIVFVTGLDDLTIETERAMMMDGAVGIFQKPVDPAVLLGAIEEETMARDRAMRTAVKTGGEGGIRTPGTRLLTMQLGCSRRTAFNHSATSPNQTNCSLEKTGT